MRWVWSPRMLRLLRLCAERGISQRETAIYLGVSPAAIAARAAADKISFHGKGGAPHGNRNGVGPHPNYRRAETNQIRA